MQVMTDRLPTHAGTVPLLFFKDIEKPDRRREGIRIPKREGVELCPLLDGKQYLVIIGEEHHQHATDEERTECSRCMSRRRKRPGTKPATLYFIGDDGSAFVASLPPEFLDEFLSRGEQGLFEALKPSVIQECQAQWGVERLKRQGDIFAYELPMTWEEVIRTHLETVHTRGHSTRYDEVRFHWGEDRGKGGNTFISDQVLGTRHRLKGALRTPEGHGIWLPNIAAAAQEAWSRTNWGFIGSGTLEAPNHPPLELKGPHVIAQAMLLRQHTEAAD